MCCTQGDGQGWPGPAALFMSPSAPFQKVLLHRLMGCGTHPLGLQSLVQFLQQRLEPLHKHVIFQPSQRCRPSLFLVLGSTATRNANISVEHLCNWKPAGTGVGGGGGSGVLGSKHERLGTSTAITGINKGKHRRDSRRGHRTRSQSQRMKYKCCWNGEDFLFFFILVANLCFVFVPICSMGVEPSTSETLLLAPGLRRPNLSLRWLRPGNRLIETLSLHFSECVCVK